MSDGAPAAAKMRSTKVANWGACNTGMFRFFLLLF
jgi:hypothetical protein